jgi:hypothetical protein
LEGVSTTTTTTIKADRKELVVNKKRLIIVIISAVVTETKTNVLGQGSKSIVLVNLGENLLYLRQSNNSKHVGRDQVSKVCLVIAVNKLTPQRQA